MHNHALEGEFLFGSCAKSTMHKVHSFVDPRCYGGKDVVEQSIKFLVTSVTSSFNAINVYSVTTEI